MSAPLSIRFEEELLSRLRRRTASVPGATPSGLVQRLVDEGLRMIEYPGIVFRDGPTGRRAALAIGPDVWEVAKVLGEIDVRGEAAITATAQVLALADSQVRLALRYYATFTDEIDAEVDEANRASLAAEQAWHEEQRLLA